MEQLARAFSTAEYGGYSEGIALRETSLVHAPKKGEDASAFAINVATGRAVLMELHLGETVIRDGRVNGDLRVDGALGVSGDVLIDGSLSVRGATTISLGSSCPDEVVGDAALVADGVSAEAPSRFTPSGIAAFRRFVFKDNSAAGIEIHLPKHNDFIGRRVDWIFVNANTGPHAPSVTLSTYPNVFSNMTCFSIVPVVLHPGQSLTMSMVFHKTYDNKQQWHILALHRHVPPP